MFPTLPWQWLLLTHQEETCPGAASSPAGCTWSTLEGDAAMGLPDKDIHMRSSRPGPNPLSVRGQAGHIPRPDSGGEGALWAAGVGGLRTGPHEEDAPNPNRERWHLAAALLMETEHSPEGADSAAHGGWGQGVGLCGGWVEFLQPASCGAASLKVHRCRTLVSWRGTTLRVVCVCVMSWLED